ncbi:hypothetical protein BVRB_3g063950 [Beta vulgaris subsp. vulgaris]|nr:hypothetical protein BVRB_3g063950 [Beta vulgaris subsp. vulgaris]
MEGSEGQQEGIQKTEQFFCKKLTKNDVLRSLSVPESHSDVFFEAQDENGEVAVFDLHSGEEWRFCLSFSKSNRQCTFLNGWLQYVKTKDLVAGHSVVFHRRVGLESTEKLHHQLFIECIAKSQRPSESGKPESSSSDRSGQRYTRNKRAFHAMLDCLHTLEDNMHLFVREKCMNQSRLPVSQNKSRVSRNYKSDSLIIISQIYAECENCILYLSLFPKDYEIDRDTLVQLWLVAGLIKEPFAHDIAVAYLEALQSTGCISCLMEDHRTGRVWYKINEFTISSILSKRFNHLSVDKMGDAIIDRFVRAPDHVTVQGLPQNLGVLKNLPWMTTLWFLRGYESHIECLPYNFFMSLRVLKVLSLSRLRTLSEFPVSPKYGCSITELKNLEDLQGSLCLSRLQNVSSLAEVDQANLRQKKGLSRLELRWSPRQQKDSKLDDEIIAYLEPYSYLTHLRILYYGGSAFPSWIANPSFKNLVSMTLFKCEQCQLLPSLGQLLSLESLNLNGLSGVKVIDLDFCGDNTPSGDGTPNVAFPKLQNFALTSMLNLEEWRDMGEFYFSSLHKLAIKNCPKLASLCSLSNVLSLQVLEISYCPLLPSLPMGPLPASVGKLLIEDCPLLKSSCSELHGQDWYKMEHIPSIWIDYEEISAP